MISSCSATVPGLSAVLRGIKRKHEWVVGGWLEDGAIERLDTKRVGTS